MRKKRKFTPFVLVTGLLVLLASCSDDELSYISIQNNTGRAIYTLPYSSEFTDGDWIQPGTSDEFYTINCDCLNGFEYFSFYYDSLIIFLKDLEEDPIKFYQDGTTVNYDPLMNPFTNPDVWHTREFRKHLPGNFQRLEEKRIYEHYITIERASVKSLVDTSMHALSPGP